MNDLVFIGSIVGANAALLAVAARILDDEVTEYRHRLAALSLRREPLYGGPRG